MNLKHLKTRSEDYINILKNRGITVPCNISIDKLLKNVKYLKKKKKFQIYSRYQRYPYN